MPRFWLAFAIVFALRMSMAPTALAWLFEEHATIGRVASNSLPTDEAATFERLWAAARASEGTGRSPQDAGQRSLCEIGTRTPVLNADGTWPCVDFGTLPAAAGDHSCNPDDLWTTVTRKTWFKNVLGDVAETDRLIRGTTSAAAKVDAWHQGNLILMNADPEYLSRAAKNNAHFVLARREDDLGAFLARVAGGGAPLNATAVYAIYHVAAMAAAAKLSRIDPASPEYAARALEVLTSESFALHFLEDSFASGHFVGMPPDASETLPERAGTHDYYCQYGLDAETWNKKISYGAHGDAFQTSTDIAMVSAAVEASLAQVLDVANGQSLDPSIDPDADTLRSEDICDDVYVTSAEAVRVVRALPILERVLDLTPKPYREDPQLPHFRSEFGGLLRADAAGRIGAGFGRDPEGHSAPGRLQSATEVGLGIGLGIEGLTTRTTDGVFYLEGSVAAYGQDVFPTECSGCDSAPARFGWGLRARIPFWLIPGDTVLGALILGVPATKTFMDMAIKAAQGSLWGHIERVRALGRPLTWQVVVGREAALYRSWTSDMVGRFAMTELELPALELRTRHEFAERLGSDALLQIGATLDWTTLNLGSASPEHTFSATAFVRLAFDGIYYFAP